MHKLIELREDKNLVIVGMVHNLNLVSRFADEVVLLSEGKLLASGKADIVLTNNSRYLFFE